MVRTLGADRSPVLLLHGLGVSGAVWQGIGRLIGDLGRLVAPDLRGHGESDKPSAGYLPRDYVGDISALLAHEPSRPLAVLGHSLGAVIAAQLAAERPEMIGKAEAVVRAARRWPESSATGSFHLRSHVGHELT